MKENKNERERKLKLEPERRRKQFWVFAWTLFDACSSLVVFTISLFLSFFLSFFLSLFLLLHWFSGVKSVRNTVSKKISKQGSEGSNVARFHFVSNWTLLLALFVTRFGDDSPLCLLLSHFLFLPSPPLLSPKISVSSHFLSLPVQALFFLGHFAALAHFFRLFLFLSFLVLCPHILNRIGRDNKHVE